MLFARAGTSVTQRLAPDRFRNIAILREVLEIFGSNSLENVQYGWQWCAWVPRQVVDDWVGPGPYPVHRD